MEVGRIAAGSSRTSRRLDPFSLPVRFEAADETADERRRVVDLHRERVVVRRSVAGMRMALNMPVSAFRGVVIRLNQKDDAPPSAIDVVLEHGDPALSLPLFSSETTDEIVAEWQAWGRVLGLPLLVAERDGSLREPFARVGAVTCRSAHMAPPPSQHDCPPPALEFGCAVAPRVCPTIRSFIAANAKSSPGIDRSFARAIWPSRAKRDCARRHRAACRQKE